MVLMNHEGVMSKMEKKIATTKTEVCDTIPSVGINVCLAGFVLDKVIQVTLGTYSYQNVLTGTWILNIKFKGVGSV